MTNSIYQAAIRELERVLPPRVVSRTLKEGLRAQDQTPDTVGLDDFEAILKGPVYRQLQVSMTPDDAKQVVTEMLDRLGMISEGRDPDAVAEAQAEAESSDAGESPPAEPEVPAPAIDSEASRRQEDELVGLRAALKPFNLYFEWPEVQKLRAQVQLLEEEQRQGREAPGLVEEAHRQLTAVRQKLEDQLVIQAGELAELEEAFERVQSIGGVKVRRLENLIGHIREAQESRQLATAELERARKTAKDLRKLVESSVYQEQAGADEGDAASVPAAALSPEVSQRLAQLDREAERHDIQKLAEDHANLLDHLPDLAERLHALVAALEQGGRVDTELAELRHTLSEAAETQRKVLTEELSQVERQARSMPAAVDVGELLQAVTVARGVLETTLPSIEDTQYIRRLYRLAIEKREELARAEAEAEAQRAAGIEEQRRLLARSRAAVERYAAASVDRAAFDALSEAVASLAQASAEGRLAPDVASRVRHAEGRLEAAVAEQADDARVREAAQLRALLSSVEALPDLDALSARIGGVRRELVRLIDASRDAESDQVQLEAIRSLVAALRRDAIDTCRSRLEQLAERASEVDAEELLGRIQVSNNVLDDDVYPDIRQLESALRQKRESYREEQFSELRRLERDAAEYVGTGIDEAKRLEAFLSRAREQLETGGVAADLRHGRELLGRVQESIEHRLADFEPRLDAALDAFHGVAMLNSEDVASVRRILKHLDSQREAFHRVSTGLRIQLEHALEDAETLLAKLQDEVDATRAIADTLMSGNVLDDVLGLFGDPAPGGRGRDDGRVSTDDPVGDWLGSFTSEAGVRCGAILGPDGLVAGTLPFDPRDVRAQVASLDQTLTRVGGELRHGALQMATIELARHAWVLARLERDRHLVIVLDTPTVLSLVSHRVRDELGEVQRLLRDSPHA